jgi:precorrin-2/cobalt-factor-2 C20-methyltransferase
MTGTLYGVGVGPGDPELITLKALRILRAAPVLAYPAPETGDSFARIIAAPHLPAGQIEISIRMPFVTERFPVQEVYDRAAEEIGGHLAAGRDVAVLCEGDPFFYGSFMHMWRRLESDFPVEVVPGVTGMSGCWTRANVPITWGNDTLAVLPGTLDEQQLVDRLRETDAAVIMKVGRNLGKVRRAIETAGLLSRAVYVERGTMENERVLPLADCHDATGAYFAMVLIPGQGRRL